MRDLREADTCGGHSAAIYGLRSKQDISIFILHPKGRTSPIQEAQMTTVLDDNVFNLAVEGTFDDCQDIVKSLFNDMEFNSRYHLGAVNSINWARILAQTVYYFAAYFAVQSQIPYDVLEPEIQFAVPTGNFGDVLAGWYAKHLGLPMAKLVVATNANDILARFWKTGRYEKADSGEPEHYAEDDDDEDDDEDNGDAGVDVPPPTPRSQKRGLLQRYPSLSEDEAFKQQQQAAVAESVQQNGASDGQQATPRTNGSSASSSSARFGMTRSNGAAASPAPAPATGATGAAGTVAETLSPAMDILVSSNFERLLFYLALEGTTAGAVAADGEVDGGQAARVRVAAEHVRVWMDRLKSEHRVRVPRACVEVARRDMIADRVSDEETSETIRKYYTKKDEYGSYVVDPHTAVGLAVANKVAKTK
jgi:threonine synthase